MQDRLKLYIPPNVANKLTYFNLRTMVNEISICNPASNRVRGFIESMLEQSRYSYPQANEIIRLYDIYVLSFVHPGEPSMVKRDRMRAAKTAIKKEEKEKERASANRT